MKHYYKAMAIVSISLLMITSCSKDDATTTSPNTNVNPSTSGAKYTPNFIGYHWGSVPGITQLQVVGWAFFDLNHDDNKEKKFFIAEKIYENRDTLRIKQIPYPIDSLGFNWPADVKDAAFGHTNDLYINATDRLQCYLDGESSWYKTTIGTYFNDPRLSGAMYGQTPIGIGSFWFKSNEDPTKTGRFFPIWIYAQSRKITGEPGKYGSPTPVSQIEVLQGSGGYDWENVESMITYEKRDGFPAGYFFDFKNWRYFTYEYSCAIGGCLEPKITWSAYKSLNKLCKWPEGWGKK